MSAAKPKSFLIRSWNDPSLEYQLTDMAAFERIYKPKGFYVVGAPTAEAYEARKQSREEKRAAREARVAAARAAKAAAAATTGPEA